MPASTIATYHAHTQFNNHSDPNQPRKREHDPTHLDQQHHAEADCALALDASLLQKDLDATTKHMPASTIATYHAHTQFNNHSDPNQPRKREHDPTHLDQQHHAEADCALALDASLLQKDLDATTKHMSAVLIALLLTIAATGIDWHVSRRAKCLSAAPTVVEANYFAI